MHIAYTHTRNGDDVHACKHESVIRIRYTIGYTRKAVASEHGPKSSNSCIIYVFVRVSVSVCVCGCAVGRVHNTGSMCHAVMYCTTCTHVYVTVQVLRVRYMYNVRNGAVCSARTAVSASDV